EGRSWRGFHHHATLCIAAYGFLVAERSRISPSARAGELDLTLPPQPEEYRPRAVQARGRRMEPDSIATLRERIARALARQLPCCPFCGTRRL
ncbi:MAG: IS701 family transposase, partial [Bryobacteraceae bacterium]